MTYREKIETNFYEKYVGDYAKRFYSPFEKKNIVEIIGFEMRDGIAFIEVMQDNKKWFWDMDDSIIITDEPLIDVIDRIANVKHTEYKGYNPYT